jgi:diguanylate cyclase (GGDEF)-like protein/PAS domain S-box-containing protein
LLRGVHGAARSAIFGLTMGLGAISTMLMSAEIEAGMYVDLRACLLALSGFFGGPLAAAITTAMALACRIAMGGVGARTGAVLIVLVVLVGLGARALFRRRKSSLWSALVMGVVASAVPLAALFAAVRPPELQLLLINGALPQASLNILASWFASFAFLQARRLSAERDLLTAALAETPDLHYIKDRQSRFAAVNNSVARFHGFDRPEDMVGKTDFDIVTSDQAQVWFASEQAIMAEDAQLLDVEEMFADEDGREHWFSTSKVPLHDADGRVIGLAGVTRDVTADKRLRRELVENRDTLSYALTEMSDGLAMFDADGRLAFCNEQYRAYFPFTGHLRQPGVHLRDILLAVVMTGEQITAPQRDADAWIETILANLQIESEEEINLSDGRWLQVRTRPTSAGHSMVVVTDVTRLKLAELTLHTTTNQLKHLVVTDGLTELLNRRAFDEALEVEIRRSARAREPLSLLMVDVDHFKFYNDQYGHLAGDECLRAVSQYLKASLKRPADLAARYGGEEFAAILPSTDEEGAYMVAEGFRRALAEARLPHGASERGYVTASVGVATYMPDNLYRDALELVRTADEALYSAKAAGRDRVFGTRITGRGRQRAGVRGLAG